MVSEGMGEASRIRMPAAPRNDQLYRIEHGVATILATLTPERVMPRAAGPALTESMIGAEVERELRGLQLRHRIFPEAAHKQTAWTMLLVAYQHSVKRLPLSVTAICGLSHEPPTTALRHLEVLERDGLLTREPDVNDRRRSWITLSKEGRKLLVRYFTELNS